MTDYIINYSTTYIIYLNSIILLKMKAQRGEVKSSI